MKSFFRVIAAVLLCGLLLTFSLWQNAALPDLAAMTAFVQNVAGRINDIKTQLGGIAGGGFLPKPSDEGAVYPEYTLSEKLDEGLEALICGGYDSQDASINVAAYGLSMEEVQAVVSQICLSHPEYFYVGATYQCQTTGTGANKTVTAIQPTYLYDKATVATMTDTYNAAIDAIVAGAPLDGTDFDKLLYLHDYFVTNYCYDYTYTIRDAYTFFTQKTGVCQAYMLALIATAEELGISSIPVTSTPMKHAWNLVELDGAWYHVDITWDDSVSLPTHTSYTYFLQSDTGLATIDKDLAEPHRDWQTTETADSTKYDGAVWRNNTTQMKKLDGAYYCAAPLVGEPSVSSDTYAIYGGSDPAAMVMKKSYFAIWRTGDANYIYTACYSGLAVWNGKLIYNTNNMICIYDPATGKVASGLLTVPYGMSVYGIESVSADGVVRYMMDGRDITGTPTYGTIQVS